MFGGFINPRAYGLSGSAAALEIDLGAFLSMKTSPEKASVTASLAFPRDLAFLIGKKSR